MILAECYTINMRKYLCCLFLCVPLMAWAQPRKGVGVVKALTGKLENKVTRFAAQAISKRTYPISNLVRPTPTSTYPISHDDIVLTASQRQQWVADYEKILFDFEQLKQESLSFLFYQSIPLERRELSTEETRQWLNKMLPLHGQLLAFYLTTRQDTALKYALDYVEYAISVVDPYLVPALRLNAQPKIAPFNVQEFFLYPDPQIPLQEPGITLEGKHIVIINDDNSLLEHFEHLYNIGVLFPGATLHTQTDALHFLLWMQYARVKPDVVFTDIQLGENNGYYVAHKLRQNGYDGGIIALTSYTETQPYARQLKAGGFDGLVSLDDRYYHKIPFFQRITQAAQLYLERNSK